MKYKLVIFALLSSLLFSCGVADNDETEPPLQTEAHKISRDFLVLYLPFDKSVADSSKLENKIFAHNVQLTEDRFGNKNSACLFNGIDSYLKIKDSDYLTPCDNKLSISLWVKVNQLGNTCFLYKGSNIINREYVVGIHPDSLFLFEIHNNGLAEDRSCVTNDSTIQIGRWYHIAATWDGISQKIYVNGKLADVKFPSNFSINNFNSDLFVGTYGGDIIKYAFNGVLDDILIFNRVLTDDEITTLFKYKIHFK